MATDQRVISVPLMMEFDSSAGHVVKSDFGQTVLVDLWDHPWQDRGRPLIEDNIGWKKTLDGRQHLMEDDLWLKINFDVIWPSIEDNLWGKTTLMENTT